MGVLRLIFGEVQVSGRCPRGSRQWAARGVAGHRLLSARSSKTSGRHWCSRRSRRQPNTATNVHVLPAWREWRLRDIERLAISAMGRGEAAILRSCSAMSAMRSSTSPLPLRSGRVTSCFPLDRCQRTGVKLRQMSIAWRRRSVARGGDEGRPRTCCFHGQAVLPIEGISNSTESLTSPRGGAMRSKTSHDPIDRGAVVWKSD